MKDNQKKYLDRVVDLIVRDTVIDYDEETLTFPFLLLTTHHISFLTSTTFLFSSYTTPFSDYSEHTYGLGEEEIEYVWDQYRDIIKDKIK